MFTRKQREGVGSAGTMRKGSMSQPRAFIVKRSIDVKQTTVGDVLSSLRTPLTSRICTYQTSKCKTFKCKTFNESAPSPRWSKAPIKEKMGRIYESGILNKTH